MLSKEMKDSGVEWIGKIPRDWKVGKVKLLGEFINGYAFKPSDWGDKGLPIIRIQNLSNPNSSYNYYEGTIDEKYIVEKGDILISWSATIDIFIWEKEEALLNQHIFKVIKSNIVDKGFLYWVMKSALVELSNYKHGSTMQHLTRPVFNNFPVPIPRIEIQKNISKIISNYTKKIDKIINDTKQSLEELKKYKQSIITQAVTKGLDQNVELKDSGIEWIGKVPETWDVIKINRLFSIKKEIANKTGYDVLSVTQRGLKVKDITQNEGQMAADYSKYQIVQPDDFVMNHMDLITGWVDLAVQEGVTSPDYRVFYNKQKEIVFNRFYLYVFQICYLNKIFYGLGQGVSNFGRWRLQTDKFLNFYLPLPTIEEQIEIVSYLDSQTNKVDSLIQEKERAIEELDKYKQSLIYEYVTGKKEV
nr:restriction endonuclease subunit S [Paenibacillus bovis]